MEIENLAKQLKKKKKLTCIIFILKIVEQCGEEENH